MLAIAQARTVGVALRAIVTGLAACPGVALARVWLTGPGDRCDVCALRDECAERALCLHLVASAGNPMDPAADAGRTDGVMQRVPIGVRAIGRVGQTGELLSVDGLPERGHGVADRAWLDQEQVRAFAALPLALRGETLGVLALYDRDELKEEHREALRILTDHAAVCLANARELEQLEARRRRLEDEIACLREREREAEGPAEDGLVGRSPAARKVQQQIDLAASSDAPVLIHGEPGTGKRLVARAIHERGPRRHRHLLKVAGGAAPGDLRLVDGGTLLLEEVAALPPPGQEALLRLLQGGGGVRAGETRAHPAAPRVIAVTNHDLRREVEAGRFREDLYYRLGVFPLEVPPLRARLDDIPLLAAHFARLTARGLPWPPPRLASAELERLRSYDWPGNVRELRIVVERAVILARGGAVAFGPLPAARRRRRAPAAAGVGSAPGGSAPLTREELRRLERESIEAALARAGGKVFGPGGAAEILGMRPTTLASRLLALGIEKPPRGRGIQASRGRLEGCE